MKSFERWFEDQKPAPVEIKQTKTILNDSLCRIIKNSTYGKLNRNLPQDYIIDLLAMDRKEYSTYISGEWINTFNNSKD